MKSKTVQLSRNDRIFYAVTNTIMIILTIIVLYPMIYVVSSSFSSSSAVQSGRVFLWPVDFSLEGYKAVLTNRDIGTGYKNSLIYTVVGTTVNVFFTMVCAYPLARKNLPYKGYVMFLFTFTMFFSGGMIPHYILNVKLGLIDSRLVMIIPGLISVYNMIIARTFIQNSIPGELLEAAQVDGCSDTRYFFTMVLPLSKAVIAVLALYYAVGHWNAYFNAFMYLNSRKYYPLQLFLREILIQNQISADDLDPELAEMKAALAEVLKYSLIIVASLPVLVVYPFVQKYFMKGVMLGSVKG